MPVFQLNGPTDILLKCGHSWVSHGMITMFVYMCGAPLPLHIKWYCRKSIEGHTCSNGCVASGLDSTRTDNFIVAEVDKKKIGAKIFH